MSLWWFRQPELTLPAAPRCRPPPPPPARNHLQATVAPGPQVRPKSGRRYGTHRMAVDLPLAAAEYFPALPQELDDLLTDDLVQFLSSPDVMGAPLEAMECDQSSGDEQGSSHCSNGSNSGRSSPLCGGAALPGSFAELAAPLCGGAGVGLPCHAQVTTAMQDQAGAPLPADLKPASAVIHLTTQPATRRNVARAQRTAAAAAAAAAAATPLPAAPAAPASDSRGTKAGSPEPSSGTGFDASGDEELLLSEQQQGGGAAAGSKRRAPDVDWRSIEDPNERRRQRRLAKNRITAARSRERKKTQWQVMEERLKGLEDQNSHLRSLLEQYATENRSLKERLASLPKGARAASSPTTAAARGRVQHIEPAALVVILTMLVVCCTAPAKPVCEALGLVLAAASLGQLALELAPGVQEALQQAVRQLLASTKAARGRLQRLHRRMLGRDLAATHKHAQAQPLSAAPGGAAAQRAWRHLEALRSCLLSSAAAQITCGS